MGQRSLEDGRPEHVHVECRDGYWWPSDLTRGLCATRRVHATVAQIEAVFVGPFLARAAAAAALMPGAFHALFPAHCPCGSDHRKLGANLLRVHSHLAPEVRESAAPLNAVQVIALASKRGDTPDATRALQALEVAKLLAGRGPRSRRLFAPAVAA